METNTCSEIIICKQEPIMTCNGNTETYYTGSSIQLGRNDVSLSMLGKNDVSVFNKIEFIEMIRLHPELYDKYHDDFKDKNLKARTWAEIGDTFHMTPSEAEAKYNSVRSSYGRYLRTKRCDTADGRRMSPKYTELSWLEPFIEHRNDSSKKLNSTINLCADETESDAPSSMVARPPNYPNISYEERVLPNEFIERNQDSRGPFFTYR